MEWLSDVVSNISTAMYSYILIIILVLGGLCFTFATKFAQIRLAKEQIKAVGEKPKDKKGVSSFQALMVSTASRVGTGNIIGVATAICLGGYGSVFWMWLIAVIGCASAFIESTLAQIYKRKDKNGETYGGPAYYIEKGLKCRPLAVVFSVLLIVTYGVGFNMLASYNLQSTFKSYSFYNDYTPWIIGGIIAVLVAVCLLGGGKRVVSVTSFLVPIMGVAYVLVALVIIALNVTSLPSILVRIFTEAFDFKAIFGGFGGSCVMYGIKRGLFSNEAGVGSAPNASASAEVSHPVKQGLVQMLSVFIDTIIICSATAFMCMCSGVEPNASFEGADYIQASVSNVLGSFGPIFITVAMVLFAFTTLLGNLYYVDRGVFYILGKMPSKSVKNVYYIIASLIILLGAGLNAGLLWDIADVTMGLMTLINIPVILILGRFAIRALKDYDTQRRQGKAPLFHAENIKLPHDVDCWK